MLTSRAVTAGAGRGNAVRAPLLSLILPVHGMAGYLPACLDSIFGQRAPAGGLEVIAVDDASPDASGAILDERAGREPRLRVIHLAERVGPGPARMRGLAEVTGEYVWFADPDDMLAAGCLVAVAGRLAGDRPDVLLIDYLTVTPGGGTVVSHERGLLAGGERGTLTLGARPALLNRTMTASRHPEP
jgi:glycosyltransferase involved in cell wall biosynthesis